MKRLKIGLNGFGRIGRAFTRIALTRGTFDIVQINTRKTPTETLAYLLQYDSVYRKFGQDVIGTQNMLTVSGKNIKTSMAPEIESIGWDANQIDVVIDATGAFNTQEDLKKHLKGSVKKVLLSAPSKDEETPHVVLGVNSDGFDFAGSSVISNCSCTTNSAAPLFKVLDDSFKVLTGFLTTTHAYTQSQSLLDDAGKTPDRSRAAALNIIPSTTGAAKAVVKTLPHLTGKIDGMSVRVPVPVVSFTDVTAFVEKKTTAEEVNAAFKKAADTTLKGILSYEEKVLVSSDYIGSPYSAIFDANYTKVLNDHMVKVFSWYDNEWGYANRLADLVEKLSGVI